jgi:CRP-like cAMP-binding protein
LKLLEIPKGTHIVTQGERGDAFYIVFSGTLKVSIDGVIVNTLTTGKQTKLSILSTRSTTLKQLIDVYLPSS